MKLKDLKHEFVDALTGIYPPEELQSFFSILSEAHLGLSRIEVALQPNKEILEGEGLSFDRAIQQLKNFEPIQYIVGETEFFGLKFKVDRSVLIPRPETEELVNWIINETQSKETTILDIGTGSGCIAITLAHQLTKTEVSAMDISKDALKIAKQNALTNKVNINFIELDVIQFENSDELDFHKDSKFDLIVSNPPYVKASEKELMQANVLRYEPEIALFVEDEDPLLFYRRIAQLSKDYLKPEGVLFFEINEYLGKDMKEMLEIEGFNNIEIKKDVFEKDRMIKCKKL